MTKKLFLTFFFVSFSLFSFCAASPVTWEQFVIGYYSHVGKGLPATTKYIAVRALGVKKNTSLYKALQKGVYLDLRTNLSKTYPWKKPITIDQVAMIVEKDVGITFEYAAGGSLDDEDFALLLQQLPTWQELPQYMSQITGARKLTDIMTKLATIHIDKDMLTGEKLREGAIDGAIAITNDPYTAYFPPTDAKTFNDEMSGSFEGIGAQMDMPQPGVVLVVAPFAGSPAAKEGLQAQDRILKIDNFVVTSGTSMDEVVRRVRGPADTAVRLTILRGSQELVLLITRKRITIDYLTVKERGSGTRYLDLNMFSLDADKTFAQAIAKIQQIGIRTLVIDLRDNPGGSLEAVAHMLDYFVPAGKATVYTDGTHGKESLYAKKVPAGQWLGDYRIIVLINTGSASASEIMAGTIRDYVTQARLIGTTSFGKGSVQEVYDFDNGSMFKLTVAKRYTGKTHTGINGKGVTPDIVVVDDPTTKIDEVLDYVEKIVLENSVQ